MASPRSNIPRILVRPLATIFPQFLWSFLSIGMEEGVYLLTKHGKEKNGDQRQTNLAHTKK